MKDIYNLTIKEIDDDLKHTEGIISMARSQDNDSAGSQFFIMVSDNPSLDGEYAAFGKVTEGYSVCKKIAGVETDSADKPLTDQVMKKVTFNGADDINEPETIK